MKKNLEIIESENKATNAMKPYVRFKTSEGWMSCFDLKECEKLKGYIGKIACVEVAESKVMRNGEEVIFHNIKKCYGNEDVNIDVEKPIAAKVTITQQNVVPKNASMYVSYAKDVFCQIWEKRNTKENDPYAFKEVMNVAINLIKQAKEAFE